MVVSVHPGRAGSSSSGPQRRQAAGRPAGQTLELPFTLVALRGPLFGSSRSLPTGAPERGWGAAPGGGARTEAPSPCRVGAGAFLDVPVVGPLVSGFAARPPSGGRQGGVGKARRGRGWGDGRIPARCVHTRPYRGHPHPSAVCYGRGFRASAAGGEGTQS